MLNVKNYKFGLDGMAILLLLAVMLPNFVWIALPPPSDILRSPSVTAELDLAVDGARVLMMLSVCLLKNNSRPAVIPQWAYFGIATMLLLYYVGWALYYAGFSGELVLLVLTLAPSMGFLLFAVSRENLAGVLTAVAFMVLHFAQCMVNYLPGMCLERAFW